MSPLRTRQAVLFLTAVVVGACGVPRPTTNDPANTPGQPVPVDAPPPEPPPATIPPGFVFPVPSPLTEGNADAYSQKVLFERTGSMCFTHTDAEPAGEPDLDGMAARLVGDEGILEDGRSYVGALPNALAALDLGPTGIVTGDVAYGIGRVTGERAQPQLPEGSVWAPRLERFELADGRTGWALTGDWTAVVERECGVLPTTPP